MILKKMKLYSYRKKVVFPITLDKLPKLFESSLRNAQRLLEDATILFKNGSFPSSILLSFLSCEESAKALLTLDHWANKKVITPNQWEKKFKKHVKKLERLEKAIQTHVRRVKKVKTTPEIPDFIKSYADFMQKGKLKFTYVDYDFEQQRFIDPLSPSIKSDTKSLARDVLRYAKNGIYCVKRERKKINGGDNRNSNRMVGSRSRHRIIDSYRPSTVI